jgi:hypothetical protein
MRQYFNKYGQAKIAVIFRLEAGIKTKQAQREAVISIKTKSR